MSLDDVVLEDWMFQDKGVFYLPECASALKNDFFFINWKKKVCESNNSFKVFEDVSYHKRSSLLNNFFLNRVFLEKTLIEKYSLIRFKESEKFVGKRFLELDPLSIAQLISFAKQVPIEKLLVKESPYVSFFAECLFNKVLKENVIDIFSCYTFKEASELTGIARVTISEGISEGGFFPVEGLDKTKYLIKGLDLALFSFRFNKKSYFLLEDFKNVFDCSYSDIFKFGFFSEDKKKRFGRNRFLKIYDSVLRKVRKSFYELDFFSEYEFYSLPKDFSFNKSDCSFRVGKKRFDLVYSFKNKILDNLAFFCENKKIKKSSFFSGNYFSVEDKALLNYFFLNLYSVLSNGSYKKDKGGYDVYSSLNLKTRQFWDVYVIKGLVDNFEIRDLN